MPQMLDNRFDELVRQKFADEEIAPSANLWEGIETQLQPRRKKTLSTYWWAAASVILAIATLLFFQKEDKIKLRGKTIFVASKIGDEVKIVPNVKDVSTEASIKLVLKPSKKQAKIPVANVVAFKNGKNEAVENNFKNRTTAVQPIDESSRLTIKTTSVLPPDVLPKQDIVIGNLYAQTKDNDDVATIAETIEKKGIRNVGDLVNLVVDKLDKRDKKIIQFNTDDDHTSIVALNIGILKFNKN